tara:strand:+ start:2209 stop:2559 length:351 start_codon:yes stop_codon:yes gene_type:complete
MGYKMKQGNTKNNTCTDTSPMKGLFGGLIGGAKKLIGGAAKGKGLLGAAMNPIGAIGGATGLFMKSDYKGKENSQYEGDYKKDASAGDRAKFKYEVSQKTAKINADRIKRNKDKKS